MPFNIDNFPFLKNILDKVYKNQLQFKNSPIKGAYDSNWYDEYNLFYNKQPRSEPFVHRVFLKFPGKKPVSAGFCHIRPVTDGSELSETYLSPPKNMLSSNNYYIKCLNSYDAYGERVSCVPFIMPETVFGMCIHASIWICLKILKNRELVERVLSIPQIQELASGSPYTDKEGLVFVKAARLLRMCRTSAFYIVNKESNLTDNQMLTELYAYVESGLPVILGVDVAQLPYWPISKGYHSIVAIGHTLEDNKVDGFIFHDESLLPYVVLKKNELLDAWHVPLKENGNKTEKKASANDYVREMLVAVPPGVSIPFHEVYHEFETLLEYLRENGTSNEQIESLIVRPLLLKSEEAFYETRNFHLFKVLSQANMPSHVWIIFMFDAKTERMDIRKSKGFFVRDATAQTELRFFYFAEDKKIVYQLKPNKIVVKKLKSSGARFT